MRTPQLTVASLALASLSACGGPPAGIDAGPSPDAGPALDGGSVDGSSDAALLGDAPGLDAPLLVVDAGSGRDARTSDAGPIATLTEVADIFCGATAEIACSAPWDCACPDFGGRPDPTECRASERETCSYVLADSGLGAGIAAGRIRTDLALLEACTAELRASYARCSGSSMDLGLRCAAAFVDVAAIGEPCAEAYCAGGTGWCSYETGTCVALPTAGRPCELACAPGLVCAEGTCAAPGMAGASCVSDAACADGLACSAGTCRALAPASMRCDETADCAASLACVASVCTDTPVATCTDGSECASLETCGFPTSEGFCRARVALGEACDSDDACADGRCDFAVGACAPRLPLGDPCGSSTDCETGLVCAISGICVRPGALGEACVEAFGPLCAEGLVCRASVCVGPPASGEPCGDAGECGAGLACIDDGSGPKCGAPRAIGETCLASTECGEDARCDFFASVCATRLGDGERCFLDEECATGLLCTSDPVTFETLCRPPAPIGERCEGFGCADGAFCRYETGEATCTPLVCEQIYFY